MKKIIFVFALVVITVTLFFAPSTLIELRSGSRLSVYYAVEYFLCPTQMTTGVIEEVKLEYTTIDRPPLNRITYREKFFSVKLSSSPYRFIYKSVTDLYDDDNIVVPNHLKPGNRLRVLYHENIVPWEKDQMPVVTDKVDLVYN